MSFLEKDNLGINGKHFYFDGYRAIDALVTFYSNDQDATTAAGITTTYTGDSSLLDKRNVLALME